ncbi:hypothetical protein POTOM_004481 [Populus tomentosa]|uniref:Uncharacterized protein n=1 Tax=Populus tomentosa TaxID=118781 RepID=A0A8X8AJW3_POPTO|nr:hypothetical protein POTOM_004481 [Populus tomentosa]
MVYSITQIVVAPIAAGRLTCKQVVSTSVECYSSIFAATISASNSLLERCPSSLLALALANKFFKDPLVAVHPAIFVS